MTNTSAYPSLPQAWGIFGLFIAVSAGTGFILSMLMTLTGYNNLSVLNFLGYTLAGILIIWFVLIKKKSSEPSIPLIHVGEMPVSLSAILMLLTLTLGVVMDPLTNLIPMPDFMKDFFSMLNDRSIFNLILLVIIAPVFEEILLRGIILDGFLRRYSPLKSIFWSSFIFGLLHLNPWQFIGAFVIGLLMGYIYWKTRSLIACIFIHLVNNGIGYVLSYIFGNEMLTLAELFDDRKNYLIVYIASAGITMILLFILHQTVSRYKAKGIVWKDKENLY